MSMTLIPTIAATKRKVIHMFSLLKFEVQIYTFIHIANHIFSIFVPLGLITSFILSFFKGTHPI